MGGVGRKRHEIDKLVLQRLIAHDEMAYPYESTLNKWKILANNRCWVCERWKQVVFFYDRKNNTVNMSRDIIGRIFMIKVN